MSVHEPIQKSANARKTTTGIARPREIICECARSVCVSFFDGQLSAIVLTGSVARDEGSFICKENYWESAGDVEFMVVLDPKIARPSATALYTIRKNIETELLKRGIKCTVDVSAVRPSYFRHLPTHIFSYELRHCGRVIWGDDDILETIPDFSADELSREDAWRLLCNRMIEQLAFMEDLPTTGTELRPRLHYAVVKLYLDMATSYLVFVGAYEPTYRGRAQRLRAIAQQDCAEGEPPFALKVFSQRITQCTEWKLDGTPWSADGRPEFWQEAIHFGHLLWRWEVMRMTKVSDDLSTSALCEQMARELKFTQKIRGWASAARRKGGFKSWRYWHRWAKLGLRATPRYMIYRVGAELTFRLPSLANDAIGLSTLDHDWVEMRSLLPVDEPVPGASVSDWRALARLILRNYREFVTSTRA